MGHMNAMQEHHFRRIAGRRAARRAVVRETWLRCRHLADHETRHRDGGLIVTVWRPYLGRVDRDGLIDLALFAMLTGSGLSVGRLRSGDGLALVLARPVGR